MWERLVQSRKVVVALLTYLSGALTLVGGMVTYAFTAHGSLFAPETANKWLAVGAAMTGLGLWLANTVIKGIAQEDAALKTALPPPVLVTGALPPDQGRPVQPHQ